MRLTMVTRLPMLVGLAWLGLVFGLNAEDYWRGGGWYFLAGSLVIATVFIGGAAFLRRGDAVLAPALSARAVDRLILFSAIAAAAMAALGFAWLALMQASVYAARLAPRATRARHLLGLAAGLVAVMILLNAAPQRVDLAMLRDLGRGFWTDYFFPGQLLFLIFAAALLGARSAAWRDEQLDVWVGPGLAALADANPESTFLLALLFFMWAQLSAARLSTPPRAGVNDRVTADTARAEAGPR